VGTGKESVDWVGEVLVATDRKLAGVTAPPHGLYLVDVGYPERYGIPKALCGPGFASPWFPQALNQPIEPTHIHPKQPVTAP